MDFDHSLGNQGVQQDAVARAAALTLHAETALAEAEAGRKEATTALLTALDANRPRLDQREKADLALRIIQGSGASPDLHDAAVAVLRAALS